jgi:hypothetical protein
MSYFTCGHNGSETCRIAFAQDINHCPPSGEILRQQSLRVAPLFIPKRKLVDLGLKDVSPKSISTCAASAEAFHLWLASEIKARKNSGTGGAL